MDKREFVQKCGELLIIAKPHLVSCKYTENDYGEYVGVTCENGCTYKIDVTANSLNAIAEAIFKAMAHK